MAHVTLIGNLRQYTGDVTELDVEAGTVRQLFRKLGEKFPELAPHLEEGLAVAIDGQIYQDALLEPIGADFGSPHPAADRGWLIYLTGPLRKCSARCAAMTSTISPSRM